MAWRNLELEGGHLKDVVTAILGGGQGSRLQPLTRDRAKPAVPLAGKFRLIDIPISNSLQAEIDRIFVLTQFNSASLHRHIAQTYRFDSFSRGFVNLMAAEQRMGNTDWYQGTADAVRQNIGRLEDLESRDVLILSGDQLYLMDLSRFVQQHREQDADITIAVKPVPRREAPALGVMRIGEDGQIVEFVEKPSDEAVIDSLTLDADTIERLAIDAQPGMVLASMGIYVFKTGVLSALLGASDAVDFGKEVIPSAIGSRPVFAFTHNGYWRDIGTIGTFHKANLDLTRPVPELNLYSEDFPIYTHPRFLPGSKVSDCEISHSVLSDGSILAASRVSGSIIGVRAVVREGTEIADSVVMGATRFGRAHAGGGDVGIGRNCKIRRAIIDLDTSIGDGCELVNRDGVEEDDGDFYAIRDGVIVIPRRAVVPSGTVI